LAWLALDDPASPQDSDELDAHSGHHDHCRNDPGCNRAADHESVGERLAKEAVM